ncbi:hypothetical protein TIFTF001_024039 [Ficus carica]|uniref:Uncharacterized protein n=1 Tax=Ficus carica TaxID=3494 RepID=A0AA88AKM2_FICCA|nr:hypothetical protein TIFTF001_024039 [Ficus carica]
MLVRQREIKARPLFEPGRNKLGRRSGGLILLWNSAVDVQIQSYVDSLVRGADGVLWRFTGFNGGDFNEVFYFSEKSGGSDHPYTSMDDSWEVMEVVAFFILVLKVRPLHGIKEWMKIGMSKSGLIVMSKSVAFIDLSISPSIADCGVLAYQVDVVRITILLDFFGSDHRAIPLKLVDSVRTGRSPKKRRRFIFEPMWMTNGSFNEMLGQHRWRKSVEVRGKIEKLCPVLEIVGIQDVWEH